MKQIGSLTYLTARMFVQYQHQQISECTEAADNTDQMIQMLVNLLTRQKRGLSKV